MDLLLSVVADPDGANMLKHTRLFKTEGGSFGRADSNDWVLPDPQRVVSSRHGEIIFADNQYFLVDQSTNGTYLNQSGEPLGKGNRRPLKDGDIIAAGDYQLKVSIRQPKPEGGLPSGLGSADFLDAADRTTFSSAAAAKMQSAQEAKQLDSWLEPASGEDKNQTGEWGYLVSGQSADSFDNFLGQESSTDPLQALNAPSGTTGNDFDPLGGFGGGHKPATVNSWGDDDAWWKDGSVDDHAPAHNHAMQFSAKPTVSARQQSPAPQSEVATASVSHAEHNPFAESFSAIAGEQVQGAPGFDMPAATAPSSAPAATPASAGFAGASQQFAPLPGTLQAPQPQPQPQPQSQSAAQSSVLTAVLAEKLGLKLSAEQCRQLEQQSAEIVEETVSRLIHLLRARTSIKNELRVQRTMIQTEANNPLKFSASARDALSVMFSGNGAFMAPVEAVRDSFDDLSDHQVAVLAGMRAGYDAMLRFFNPEQVVRRSGNQGGVFASKSARNWENFVEMYKDLVSDPDACYRKLFGDEFASTYESQLSELKNARHFSKS
ncbi:type VI secretion system-associated FHA domain protein TagH [Microbulbifer pacificus]|uniref:type VI secretion system-associated FHA domain protein TagH n=1 Tax=Microbulbifer pacificus TaxID=407164 RepID=UPI000CF4CE5F|nr:type VI secretion system-associated FHA domain protein TagH [Microbulbifer pacificus]